MQSFMKQQEFSLHYKLYVEMSHQMQTLLKQMVSQLKKVRFENPPHVPFLSSAGVWYDVHVEFLLIDPDGYLVLVDSDGDKYFKENVDLDTDMILVSEIREQTDYSFE